MYFRERLDSEMHRIYEYIQLLCTKSQNVIYVLNFAQFIWMMKLLFLDEIVKVCKIS